MMDDEDARVQAERRARIRALLTSGDRVDLCAYPHYHGSGFAVFTVRREAPIIGEQSLFSVCTLTTEPLPEGIVDSDIMVMDATSPDPERAIRAWLAREFPGVSLENVRVERYLDTTRDDDDDDDDDEPLTAADLEAIRGINLTSCDFVGDSGCVDPNCWQCHSPLGPENLRCLAKNLSSAAMLCRAWQQRDSDPAWRPGCNIEEEDRHV